MMSVIQVSWGEVRERIKELGVDHSRALVYGVPTGGMIAAGLLQAALPVWDPSEANVILDDISDSGVTESYYREKFPNAQFIALFSKSELRFHGKWVEFPWETAHPGKVDAVRHNVMRTLQWIGENPGREGLVDTPQRVERMYGEIFRGYHQKPEDVLTVFDSDGYDQIVLLKDIEVYSMCEHHMMPFFGKAHVAYIPGKKIVGISKLARLVDIYARRLQIQERIGLQVTDALMNMLQPLGAACIIEASHLCMRMRGVEKQNSTMVTSSLRGCFLTDQAVRQELMYLISRP
jgi:GTP cyclohydrolase I